MRIHSMIAASAALTTLALAAATLPAAAVTNTAAARSIGVPPWASCVARCRPTSPPAR